ncbi:hypothetical protein EZI54_06730 [Marinobacter halodurans]|uniref:Uncharacterized protein n=1 Tax=Marinobacter halodurans TaxID=2528979 RepID=A0ABY1ZMV0_9GAMM|nr:hypothetical protein [Marinobacter halodurans]TBW57721.1 hypothetical protein EZI54_06730 [Marinobacter halodurans]
MSLPIALRKGIPMCDDDLHAKPADWSLNLEAGKAEHASGLVVQFKGRPRDRGFEIVPSPPEGMEALRQCRLVRHAVEIYREAWDQRPKQAANHEAGKNAPKVVRVRRRRILTD